MNPVTEHKVSVGPKEWERKTIGPNGWTASCVCGWHRSGTEGQTRAMATTHMEREWRKLNGLRVRSSKWA
jgi:uncharacterized protein YbdZ (MbtH family)